MKLYYAPGACSLSPHIVAREAKLKFELIKVNLGEHKTEGGDDYYAINPKGYVPALELDNGDVLTEGTAIVQFLADLVPTKNLIPLAGDFKRYRLQEWLNFIATEVHKNFSLLYGNPPEEIRAGIIGKIEKRLGYTEQHLSDGPFLMGKHFTVADAYLFAVARWCDKFKISLAAYPNLSAYMARVSERPAVKEAMKAEGLL